MTRVEWTRLEGSDVEAVVAMFVNREHPNSVRITPSRGDGGVDILDRGAAIDGSDVVYQVKRYAGPLTSSQKREVENSLETLLADPRWSGLSVREWHLAMPWDPTPEADAWIQELADAHGLRATWHGLAYVEQLAAKYPEIIDYYLHGGRSRIEEAYAAVTAAFALDRADLSGLTVPQLSERVQAAIRTLDSDPHYRYEMHFGEGELPEPQSRPGLMMTWMSSTGPTGRWVAVDVIARCAASETERPITISGRFLAEAGSDFESDLRDFLRFGTPFTSPSGAFEGDITAPGGLGGRLEKATVHALPVGGELGDNTELHVELLDPDGAALAEVDLNRTERSQGTDGVRVLLEESHHVFMLEDRYDLIKRSGSRKLAFGNVAGEAVLNVHSGLTFVELCRAPNRGRLSVRHTPAALGLIDQNFAFEWPEEQRRLLVQQLKLVGWLAQIQTHASSIVRMPQSITREQVEGWKVIADLLSGKDVTLQYPEGHAVTVELGVEVTSFGEHFGVSLPLVASVGDQLINLGQKVVWFDNPTVVDQRACGDHFEYSLTTPGRQVRYSLHSHPDAGDPERATSAGS